MDSPHDHQPGAATQDDQPPMPGQAELERLLDASEADVAAGRTTPLAPVLARMRAIAERIEPNKPPRRHG